MCFSIRTSATEVVHNLKQNIRRLVHSRVISYIARSGELRNPMKARSSQETCYISNVNSTSRIYMNVPLPRTKGLETEIIATMLFFLLDMLHYSRVSCNKSGQRIFERCLIILQWLSFAILACLRSEQKKQM